MRRALSVIAAAGLIGAACGNKSDKRASGPATTDPHKRPGVARDAGADPLVQLGRVPGSRFVEILEVQALADGRVMYCSGVRGLVVLDARNPRDIKPVHQLRSKLSHPRFPRCQHLAVSGDYVYASNRGDEVQTTPFVAAFEVTARGAREVASYAGKGVSIEGIDAVGKYVYVAAHDQGVLVLERKDGGLDEIARLGGIQNAWDVAAVGPVLYVANGKAGLVSVDISDPSNPSLLGRVSFDGNSQSLSVDTTTNTAWVAAGVEGVVAVDVREPRSPRVVGTYDSPGSALQVTLSGQHAFVADWNDVRVLDIADRTKPRVIATERIKTGGGYPRVLGASAYKNYVYVGEWTGLYAYELKPDARAPDLWVETGRLDFGVVASGSRAKNAVIIENHGTKPLEISSIAVAGAKQFSVDKQRARLEPGGAALVEVVFAASDAKEQRAELVLRSNDPDEAERRVALSANIAGKGVGQLAPDIVGKLLNGKDFRLSELRGKVVVLAYFSTF